MQKLQLKAKNQIILRTNKKNTFSLSMSSNNLLIVGLGNPDKDYEGSRHNCGADYVRFLSERIKITLSKEDKFFALYGSKKIEKKNIHLSIPSVYVNESGKTVSAIKNYLKLSNADILIVHDELDLPLGKIKLKEGGGHGGHNGLRNIIDSQKGDASFLRMRIGIDRPRKGADVVQYVLGKVNKKDRKILDTSFENSLDILDSVIKGKWQQAMLELHT